MSLFQHRTADSAQNKHHFRREFVLYTLIYAVFFSVVFLPVICRDGFILGGDGYTMYYPAFVNFRRSILEFGSNLSNGAFRFPMMNFNYGFGIDNLTSMLLFLAFPPYLLCVFLPVSSLPTLLTGIIFFLDYLAGISFLCLCRHFKHYTYWNCLMALSYACANCFMNNYMFNPHFMYMLVAFPLMVIGIDRVIQKTGWRLLCFCTFWLSFTNFTLLVYTLPFLALFALIHIRFVSKEHYFLNLFKAFFRCLPVLLIGFLLSAVAQFPFLYLLKNSARSLGNPTLNFWSLLKPDFSRMSKCFYLYELNHDDTIDITPMFIAIPGLLLILLVLPKHKELRIHLLSMIACVTLPLIDYGINGFQYSLVRWGYAPALLFAFAGSVGMSEFPSCSRRQLRRTISVLCFYWITYSSFYAIEYYAGVTCSILITTAAVCRMIPPLCKYWDRFCTIAKKRFIVFWNLLKGKEPSAKRYFALLGMTAGILCGILGLFFLIFFPDYYFYPQLLINAGIMILASVILLKKKQWANACTVGLAVCFFGSSVFLYSTFHNSSFEPIQEEPLFQMLKETSVSDGETGRMLYLNQLDDSNSEDLQKTESEHTSITMNENASDLYSKMFYAPKVPYLSVNSGFIYSLPEASLFYNVIDNDLYQFLDHCGLDGDDLESVNAVLGFNEREELYSLFGIQALGIKNDEVTGFGVQKIRSEETASDAVYRLYSYDYALPLSVTYDSYMSKESYDGLSASVFPYAVLQSAYLETPDNASVSAASVPQSEPYRCNTKMKKEFQEKNSIGMDIFQYTIELEDDVTDCFLYLETDNSNVRYPSAIPVKDFSILLNENTRKTYSLINNLSNWQWTRRTNHYAFPLGYQEAPVHTLSFELPMECEELSVYAIPSSVLTEAYAARSAEYLRDIQISTNQLDGDITVSSDKLLSVSLIHNDGWRVFVDGQEAPLCKVNGLFLGVQLPQGEHHVRFVYRTTWLTEGIICTCISVMLWILMEILSRKQKSKAGKANAGDH